MPPRTPAPKSLTQHPALAFGRAIPPDVAGDGEAHRAAVEAATAAADASIHAADGTGVDGLELTGAPPEPAENLELAPLADDDFMGAVTRIFEEASTPPAETSPVPAAEPESVEPAAPIPPDTQAPPADPTTPPVPPDRIPSQDARTQRLEALDAWMSGLSPEQLYAMQQAAANPAIVTRAGGVSVSAPVAPAEPLAPYSPDDFLDPRAAEALNAQHAVITELRAALITDQQARLAVQQSDVESRVTRARDEWASTRGISAEEIARLEAAPHTMALMRQYASGRSDYEAVTREVLDHAAWLDPQLRDAQIAAAVATHLEANSNDLARVRDRKTRAAQVTGVAGGSAPRVDPVNVTALPKDQRAALATDFLAERMQGGAAS